MILNLIVAISAIATIAFIIWRTNVLIKEYDKELEESEKNISEKTKEINTLSSENMYVKAENNRLKKKLNSINEYNEELQTKLFNTKCIDCGNPSNGKHFCYTCFAKYKGRSIDVRIKNCWIDKIIDPYGNKDYLCEDGTLMRSRAEALIGSHLFGKKIRYIYEKAIYYTENGETKALHPDFYLPDFNVYIEYNEMDTEEYLRKKNFAMQIYLQKGMKVFVMTPKELNNIEAFFAEKIAIS